MVLGQLQALPKLKVSEQSHRSSKKISKKVELSNLEVVQLFHVSPTKNRESILTYGLVPKSKPDGYILYPPRIFVSTLYEEAAFDYVNYEDVDVWSFYLPKHLLYPDEFSSYANHYYTEHPVPWYKLSLFKSL